MSRYIDDVDKIIDPSNYLDGTLVPELLTRYLIRTNLTDIPNWGVDASENDIIQYNGSAWTVVFDASSQSSTTHFLHNTFTSKQYKWTGSAWISSYEGEYNPGFWRLVL